MGHTNEFRVVGLALLDAERHSSARLPSPHSVGFGGWEFTGENTEVVELRQDVALPDRAVLVYSMGQGAPGTRVAAGVATRAAMAVQSVDFPTRHEEAVHRLLAARKALESEATGPLGAMNVGMSVLVLDPGGRGTLATVGNMPAYLIVDGYGGRVDSEPGSAVLRDLAGSSSPGLLTERLTDRRFRELALSPRDRLLFCSVKLEDAGIVPRWRPADMGPERRWLRGLANEAVRNNGAPVVLLAIGIQPTG